MRRVLAGVAALSLAACSGSETAQQKAALEATYATHPVQLLVLNPGEDVCTYGTTIGQWMRFYRGVPGMRTTRSEKGDYPCLRLAIDPSVGAKAYPADANHSRAGTYVTIGRYVVDKVGDAVNDAGGRSMVPVEMHLETTPAGKALVANGATGLAGDREPVVADGQGRVGPLDRCRQLVSRVPSAP